MTLPIRYRLKMHYLKYFLILNFAHFVLSTNSTDVGEDGKLKEIEYSEGTSVEPRYSLPPVKIGDSSENPNNVVPASLQRMLNFFNTEVLMVNWPKFKHKISKECQKDMDEYIEGLRSTENWALKSKFF